MIQNTRCGLVYQDMFMLLHICQLWSLSEIQCAKCSIIPEYLWAFLAKALMSEACQTGFKIIKRKSVFFSLIKVWNGVDMCWLVEVEASEVCYLNVLNPSHVHPGLGLVRFELDSQLVALVGANKNTQRHIISDNQTVTSFLSRNSNRTYTVVWP